MEGTKEDKSNEYDFEDAIEHRVKAIGEPLGLNEKGVLRVTTRLFEKSGGRPAKVTDDIILVEVQEFLATP